MNSKGISNLLSFITISIVLLIIGFSIYYIAFQQTKIGQSIISSEERKAEAQLEEKISILYHGIDGLIVVNDGNKPITIKKAYVDNNIINLNEVVNPNEDKLINIPYGQNLMLELSSGKIIKIEKAKPTITEPYTEATSSENTIAETSTQQQTSQESSSQQTQTSETYSKTTYTSTITTEIPIQTYSYITTTSTSYLTTMTISISTSYEVDGVWTHDTHYYTYIMNTTITYEYTLTIVSPYTSYKTTTYITIIDPIIIENSSSFSIVMAIFSFTIICVIILKRCFE
ncbi:MAG: hypothetical protein QW272_09110 [Candidatus Methanomethylicaceae archaeon]